MTDEDLVALGTRELDDIGLLGGARVVDGTVVRMPKAYPVYDDGFMDALGVVRDYLARFANLQVAGRNGMHKYNNQDHSMLTAMLAVKNILGEHHDVWAVNADDEYHEESDVEVDDVDSATSTPSLPAMESTQPQAAVMRGLAPASCDTARLPLSDSQRRSSAAGTAEVDRRHRGRSAPR